MTQSRMKFISLPKTPTIHRERADMQTLLWLVGGKSRQKREEGKEEGGGKFETYPSLLLPRIFLPPAASAFLPYCSCVVG
jgi:hypothetical protein